MTKKLKTVGLAFTGLIIYMALSSVTPYIFSEHVYAWLVAVLLFSLLGGAYYKVILGRIKPDIIVSRNFLLTALGIVIFFSYVSMCTSTLILQSVNDTAYLEQMNNSAEMADSIVIASLLISIFIAPIAEELIFRGCMFRFLSEFNKSAAMIISSLLFAAYHGTIVHMYAGFFGGLVFCCIYDKTHKLRYSIAAHSMYNLVTTIISCFSYPEFMTEVWWVVTINSLLFLFLAVLFMSFSPEVSVNKSELTEKQKRERERTKKIVEDVLNEHKASK